MAFFKKTLTLIMNYDIYISVCIRWGKYYIHLLSFFDLDQHLLVLFFVVKKIFKKLYFLKMIIYNKIRGEVFWQII